MKNRALFLDRDGVINQEIGRYVYRPEDFEFIPEIFDLARSFYQQGYLLIVITNQGGIAKGLYTVAETDELHQMMKDHFFEEGCPLTEVYFSPCHKEVSKNIMSKPDSLMFEKAIAKFNIDPLESIMIGDKERDIRAAQKVGCKTVLIGDEIIEDPKPDQVVNTIEEIVFPF